jgi:hypothetical protein
MKINFIYKADPSKCSTWSLEEGLRKSFEDIGALNYSVDIFNNESWIDVNRLKEYPIFMVDPYVNCFRSIVPFLKGFKKIMFESESIQNSDKTDYLWKKSMQNTQKEFDDVYTVSEKDSEDYFGRKVKYVIAFIDTEMFHPVEEYKNTRILFIGSPYNQFRKSLCASSFVRRVETIDRRNSLINNQIFVKAICEYKYYVSTESFSGTFTAKPFQGMACKRLVFIQRSDSYKTAMEIFKDKVHCVYFDNLNELMSLWIYYEKHLSEYEEIRDNGYNLVRSQFDTRHFAQRVIDDLKEEEKLNGKNEKMDNRYSFSAV